MELQTDIQDHPSYPVVQQAISGQETIRWIGKPDPLHAIRKTWIVSLFGLFFGTVAYFIISNMMSFNRGFSLSTTTGPSSSFRLIGFFIASVFAVIVIWFVFAPLWEYLIAIGRVYAITNERALIISHFPSNEQRSFYPGDIKYVQVKGKGVGDVIFDFENEDCHPIQEKTRVRSSAYGSAQSKGRNWFFEYSKPHQCLGFAACIKEQPKTATSETFKLSWSIRLILTVTAPCILLTV